MKKIKSINYIKNGIEITKKLTYPFSNKNIFKQIFESSKKKEEGCEEYIINKDIQYVHLKNVTFDKPIKFISSPETIIILEECVFQENFFIVENGYIEIVNPFLNSNNHVIEFDIRNAQDFSFQLHKNQVRIYIE